VASCPADWRIGDGDSHPSDEDLSLGTRFGGPEYKHPFDKAPFRPLFGLKAAQTAGFQLENRVFLGRMFTTEITGTST
jgi:hypothetical protein